MKKVALLINGDLGLKVLQYLLIQDNVEISGVVLNSIEKRSPAYFDRVKSLLKKFEKDLLVVTYGDGADINEEAREVLQNSDYGVSALFGHILPASLLSSFDCEIINLHPSLLPIGRGADPIPWSIIDQQDQGVTIHIIDSGLDTGGILSQRAFRTSIGMNSGVIYEIATNLLLEEFKIIFNPWINGILGVTAQLDSPGSFRKSMDLEKIRVLNPSENGTFGEFLRKLQALTFADGRKPLFLDESGKLWKIDVSLTLEGEEFEKGKMT
jgi:methionyl-tRNA formyltransferase